MSNPPPGGLTTNQSAILSKFILGTNEETGFTYRESVKAYRTGLRDPRASCAEWSAPRMGEDSPGAARMKSPSVNYSSNSDSKSSAIRAELHTANCKVAGRKCKAQRPRPLLLQGKVSSEEHSYSGPDASRHTRSDEYDNCSVQRTAYPNSCLYV